MTDVTVKIVLLRQRQAAWGNGRVIAVVNAETAFTKQSRYQLPAERTPETSMASVSVWVVPAAMDKFTPGEGQCNVPELSELYWSEHLTILDQVRTRDRAIRQNACLLERERGNSYRARVAGREIHCQHRNAC